MILKVGRRATGRRSSTNPPQLADACEARLVGGAMVMLAIATSALVVLPYLQCAT
jgi:hypothetical protein